MGNPKRNRYNMTLVISDSDSMIGRIIIQTSLKMLLLALRVDALHALIHCTRN